ncbi:MAG: hypothetical protein K0A99_12530 [Desulfoarculaceae bacterium]|nr:hypothetical protein [Desulfoarculaceae bacterium]
MKIYPPEKRREAGIPVTWGIEMEANGEYSLAEHFFPQSFQVGEDIGVDDTKPLDQGPYGEIVAVVRGIEAGNEGGLTKVVVKDLLSAGGKPVAQFPEK